MLQGLPMTLAQIKAGNIFQNLLNRISQIWYFLYLAKEITQKLYNSIENSIHI